MSKSPFFALILFVWSVTLLLITVTAISEQSGKELELDDTKLLHHIQTAIQSSPDIFQQKLRAVDHVKKLSRFQIKEKAKSSVHKHFKRLHPVLNKNVMHQVVFAVKMKNMDKIKSMLHDISDPNSQNYGKHLSGEEVAAITRNPASVHHLLRFLEMHNVKVIDRTLNDEFITAEASIYTLESIFNTEFNEYEVISNPDQRVIRTEEYSLPTYLADHVTAVFHTIHFPDITSVSKSVTKKNIELSESISLQANIIPKYVTPALINQVYGISSNIGSHLASQGVYETINQFFSPADLEKFQKRFQLTVESVAQVIGGHSSDRACKQDGGDSCVEANLDIQYLMATAQQVPSTYYYWSGKDFMVQWLVEVSKMQNPPLVFSISYGSDEVDLPLSYGTTFDEVAMRLSIRGVTLVASSGDDGAVSSNARKNALYCGYAPSFPASSPYVVAVGGTMGPENGYSEVVCQADKDGDITSGGGFSIMYEVPFWQTNATSAYFQSVAGTKNEPVKGFNRGGRGIPDISLLAHNYVITLGGNFSVVSGTSASSPVFAGMISLVNSARLSAGKSALGWVNPALYQFGNLFARDITQGDNHCVASGTVCCAQGFKAVPGWDPVTGLGSLDFAKFKEVLVNLGNNFNHPTLRPSPGPGQPSLLPTSVPISIPTMQPSLRPALGPGWFYMNDYQEESCQGPILSVSAVPAGKCMVEYDKDKKAIGSRMYFCYEDSAVVGYFTDQHCSQHYLVGEEQYYFGCAYKVEDYYYASSFYSMDLKCSNQPNIPPLPLYDGSYAVQSSFDSVTGCIDGTVSSVDATLQRHCFDLENQGVSYKVIFPKIYIYTGSNCRKLRTTEDLGSQCQEEQLTDDANGDTDDNGKRLDEVSTLEEQIGGDDDDGVDTGFVELYSKWSDGHYTIITSSPTLVPTFQPTYIPSYSNTSTPTIYPSPEPSIAPSINPSAQEILQSAAPVSSPTEYPTKIPTEKPAIPSSAPSTDIPIATFPPSNSFRTDGPTPAPSTLVPTLLPTEVPTVRISTSPSFRPSFATSTLSPSTGSSSEEEDNSEKSKKPSLSPNLAPSRSKSPNQNSESSSEEESEKTRAPTLIPSVRPSIGATAQVTLAPSAANSEYAKKGEIKLTVDQVLNGITFDQWNQTPEECFLVLQKAVIAINQNVDISDVVLKSVSPAKGKSPNYRYLESISAVNVTYVIVVKAKQPNIGSSGETVQLLKDSLVDSVNQGKFNDVLFATAASYQVQSMIGVTTSTLVITNVVTVNSNPNNTEEPPGKTSPIVTGLIVTVGFLAVLIASVFYYHTSKKAADKAGSTGNYNQVSLESDSTHSSINPLSAKVADEDEEIEIELANRSKSGYGLVSNPMTADSTHGLV